MITPTTSRNGSWIPLNERRAVRTARLFLLLLALPAAVQAQFTYVTNYDGTITITKYTGGGAVTIPSTITGRPVTSIGDFAFYGCGLTSVTFGTNVTSIGVDAFYDCTSLTNVTLGNRVTSIGGQAFEFCCSLTGVTIPYNVTRIEDEAFAACTSLIAITVDTNNPAYSSVAGVLFTKSQITLVQCPGGRAGAYTIPNSVSSIGVAAFEYCSSLTSVTIPNNVTSIGIVAFEGCTSLSSVTIPNSVTSIWDNAFMDCTSLTRVTIGNGVTSIGASAFSQCSSLASVTIPDSVTAIGSQAFASCTSLTNVTIGSSVTSVGYNTFGGCYSLTSVTIGDGVTEIGDYAFDWCSSLTSLTIGNSVTNIGNGAFWSCRSLTSITIPNSVTSIGDSAFEYCTDLWSVYFKGNAPSLGGTNVFSYANNATVYYLPGTSGWGQTYGGRPTVLWNPPIIQASPRTQTAEAGSPVGFGVKASSPLPLFYLWYLNSTNLIICSTNCELQLTSVQFGQSGAYTVVISNVLGAVTSAPAMLNIIAAVERRPVPAAKVTGQTGSLFNMDYANSLSPAPNWTMLDSVSLTGMSGYCFDPTLPLPPQRFYRAWQTTPSSQPPTLDLHVVPAITLTGTVGSSVRLDYINRFGPIDAWVTLDTVTLTNTSQLYFDVSAPGQPQRLYRLVPSP